MKAWIVALLDQHAMNAVELGRCLREDDAYPAFLEVRGEFGGENGETDLLCAMAMALTRFERRFGSDAPWDSDRLPFDWRDCCSAFASAVLKVIVETGQMPVVSDVLAVLTAIVGGC